MTESNSGTAPQDSPGPLRGILDVKYLAELEKAVPGSAGRIIAVFEKDAAARREADKELLAAAAASQIHQHKIAVRGQWIATAIAILGVAGGIGAIYFVPDHWGKVAGGAVSGTTMLSLVSMFLLGRRLRDRESAALRHQPSG